MIKQIYKILRTIFLTLTFTGVTIYLLTYILLSLPPIQNKIKEIAQKELSSLTGGKIIIEDLTVSPFNELSVRGLEVFTPQGEKCLYIESVGAGISIYRLLWDKKIELTYGEIIGLNAFLSQKDPGAPLNIQFLIDAFSPKEKKKEPAKFDLKLRNVVLRKSSLSFNRDWEPIKNDDRQIDLNHIKINNLKADIALPRLSNEEIIVDLRRLGFNINNVFEVNKIAFLFSINDHDLRVSDLYIDVESSKIQTDGFSMHYADKSKILSEIKNQNLKISFLNNIVTPSDFSPFLEPLKNITQPFNLNLEVDGDLQQLELKQFSISNTDYAVLNFVGTLKNLGKKGEEELQINNFETEIKQTLISELINSIPGIKDNIKNIIQNLGSVKINTKANLLPAEKRCLTTGKIETAQGEIEWDGKIEGSKNGYKFEDIKLNLHNCNIGFIPGASNFGFIEGDIKLNGELKEKNIDGELDVKISEFQFNGKKYEDVVIALGKENERINGEIKSDNDLLKGTLIFTAGIEKERKLLELEGDIEKFYPGLLKNTGMLVDSELSLQLYAFLEGEEAENVEGKFEIEKGCFSLKDGRKLNLEEFKIEALNNDERREISLQSDWLDGEVSGNFRIKDLITEVKLLLNKTFPSFFQMPDLQDYKTPEMDFSFYVKEDNAIQDFFDSPLKLLQPAVIEGGITGTDHQCHLGIDIPFIQQGSNKLIYDTDLYFSADGTSGEFNLKLRTVMPVKRGDMGLILNMRGEKDNIDTDLTWRHQENDNFNGRFSFDATFSKNEFTNVPQIKVEINPSRLSMGSEEWFINPATILYADKIVEIDNFKIWHDNQYVEINGKASDIQEDMLKIILSEIDVDYVFDTLKINYVTFGGTASGEVEGRNLMTSSPVAETKNFEIKNLSYNGCVIGDGKIKSHWDNLEKEVAIGADIYHDGKLRVKGEGGVWLTRDSLDFKIKADKVPVGFIQPFMQAFSSDVGGIASGEVELGGSFKDIDLVGEIFADSVSVKLDYTNTYYHGSDSVYLLPGKILIPSFRLYDKFNNTMLLTGELTHRYFHDPSFTFKVNNADHILCYDTNSAINPDWYGTLFGSGNALVTGYPGFVRITADMNVVGDSRFTFVLNETLAAADYSFLTFTDKKKEEMLAMQANIKEDIISKFKKKVEAQSDRPSDFEIGIMATVTPSVLFTLVMDPRAGDKITARGSGALQVEYGSESDEMVMYGKYTLEEGNYNFSLQDLILRDFKIQPGSSISFNGDPLKANLDIAATYRVNTNLSDLDKSFSNDRDLARTNVPVDAVLMVKGDTQHPEITFDIELPTLTQDVERKVKSIISTEDMMNRQIIYLLALNRFYTPEYMGSTSNGGELTAVASTTLSSQLSNMLGQLTDKFTLSPSFRSDKGDFSDLEVDLALSSRLLNNRLLVNGNFGYRDKNNSSTTFVGDFDIEYLLSKNGNLRLKAYNHFNDQNYYLREALTTQGLGVIYRRDFNDPFTFLKRKKSKEVEKAEEFFDIDYENMNQPEEDIPELIEDD